MHKHILFFPALLACPLLAGCGSSDQSYACDDMSSMEVAAVMPAHLCAQYDDIPSDSIAMLQTTCTTMPNMGKNVGSCPTANRLGSCTTVVGGITQHLFYYSDVGSVTAAQAQTDCTKTQMGTWSGS